jgi:arsenate reductase (thioredoxin)
MAAAYLNDLAGDRYEAVSAGVEPVGGPHPEAAAAMAEDGIELDGAPPTRLTPELVRSADRVVGLGGSVQDWCPSLAVPADSWGLPDPAGRPVAEVRVIREATRRLVERLVARLDAESAVR